MNQKKPILCVGALTCDLVLQLPSLPAGAGKYVASRQMMVAAGMATSAATAVARLGHRAELWASAGDDVLGDFLLAELDKDKIATTFVRRVSNTPSATAAIVVDAHGERIIVPHYDPALLAPPADGPPISEGRYAAVLADVRWPAAAGIALDQARAAGIPAILDLDVGSPDILASLASRATHIVASLPGASVLTGEGTAEDAVRALGERFSAFVAVTQGEHGLAWCGPGEKNIGRLPAFPVQAVDTTAAGDIFHGAFAVALAEVMAVPAALRLASAAAAIKCTRYGSRAGAPSRVEVEVFLAGSAVHGVAGQLAQ